jgi:hypothetical protein
MANHRGRGGKRKSGKGWRVVDKGFYVGDIWAQVVEDEPQVSSKRRGKGFTLRAVAEASERDAAAERHKWWAFQPSVRNTRKYRGEVAESVFLTKAISMGFAVMKPWGDSERYDFVLDAGGELWRVQVKSAYRATKDGGYTIHAHGNESKHPYTKDEVDVVVAYIVPEDAWYVIPIEAFKEIKSMKLFPSSKRRRSRHEKYREAWCWMNCKRGQARVERKCRGGRRCVVK